MALTEEKIESLLGTKRRSILYACKDEVLRLRKEGVTLSSIKKWLLVEYKIETSCENIRQFCLRNMQVQVVAKNKQSTKKRLFENLEKDE